jgi:hypothetical protein
VSRLRPVTLTPSSRRFVIMALLFVTVVINYLDRSTLSIAAPSIAAEFKLHPVQLGLVFSAFGWTYNQAEIELTRESGGIPDLSSRITMRRKARAGSGLRDFGVVLGRQWTNYAGSLPVFSPRSEPMPFDGADLLRATPALIDGVLAYYGDDPSRWWQTHYHNGVGGRCLSGAARYVRKTNGIRDAQAAILHRKDRPVSERPPCRHTIFQ